MNKFLQVPLGILRKNENKGDEMIDILKHLHQYVPSVSFFTDKVLSTGETAKEEKASFHRIIVGGDQLTAARIRAGQKGKLNGQSPSKRLEGIVPAVEDWHAKANLLGVSNDTY